MNTTTTPDAGPEKLDVIIQVAAVAGAQLHPEDLDDANRDAISGYYGYSIDPEAAAAREVDEGDDPVIEAALDEFHDEIAIKVLDNYEIVACRCEDRSQAPCETTWA
ncbi:hypothetical protein [Erythrobacter aureus]|uniref:Uncharacterized protein n=1 Tax=Erythrobacter aureus TaxID=2182384 RepID=A0A345YJA1_9SPHN|nr:hypothetical protein [Erythrobacter aureus]AXK44003.1 hypothetical protein DVR09_16245 [Erythrobacter aureus]